MFAYQIDEAEREKLDRIFAEDQRLFEAFSKLDHDGDRYISRGEIKRVMTNLGPEMDPEIPNIARKILSVDHPQSTNHIVCTQ